MVISNEHWDDWVFDWQQLLLELPSQEYEIDLERVDTAAEMLDWIYQIQHKPWATPTIMFGLLNAFDDIFDAQSLVHKTDPIDAAACVNAFKKKFRIRDETINL